MQDKTTEKMKHMSFVLPKEEHQAFRLLCFMWNLSPSEALRTMVRIALSGEYADETTKNGGQR